MPNSMIDPNALRAKLDHQYDHMFGDLFDRAEPYALYFCACGNVEDLPPGSRPVPCSAECHIPRCPTCHSWRHDLAEEHGLRPLMMMPLEPFRSDRLLPRTGEARHAFGWGGSWSFDINYAGELEHVGTIVVLKDGALHVTHESVFRWPL